MKPRKTYFASTFQVLINILLIIMMLFFVQIGMMLVKRILISNTSDFMTIYINYATILVNKVLRVINEMIIIGVVVLIALLIPEWAYRIKNASLKNWLVSIYYSLQIRKFIKGNETDLSNDNNKRVTLRKSVIDVRNKNVYYSAKLSNDLQAHKKFIELKDILVNEITNAFPEYSFSQMERYKHCVKVEGTKIR